MFNKKKEKKKYIPLDKINVNMAAFETGCRSNILLLNYPIEHFNHFCKSQIFIRKVYRSILLCRMVFIVVQKTNLNVNIRGF